MRINEFDSDNSDQLTQPSNKLALDTKFEIKIRDGFGRGQVRLRKLTVDFEPTPVNKESAPLPEVSINPLMLHKQRTVQGTSGLEQQSVSSTQASTINR